ncbi:hypothetical protein [Massilia aerilata]|uniref:Uncharacterized protein n=1 Tax=Massilia aerilata TaxID=453817 RepID=A0ABW0S3L0_9BURK
MISGHPIRRPLWIAAIYLLTSVVLNALRQHQILSAEMVERLMGMLMGAVVVVSANAIPKKLVPLTRLSCDPAREQTLRRLGAWTLVLGGLGWTLAYAIAPITIASTLAICLLAPALFVVAGITARCAWRRYSARGSI